VAAGRLHPEIGRVAAWADTAATLTDLYQRRIMQAGDYLNTALVFAGIITIAIAGLVLDTGLRGLLMLADPSRRR
jgi:hypothetical protein